MAKATLKAKRLPNKLWAEAVHTTVNILNRSPTKIVVKQIPFKPWKKTKSKLFQSIWVYCTCSHSVIAEREV